MHFLQIIDNQRTKNPLREKCIESVKRFVTEKDTYTIKEISYDPDFQKMIYETDQIRFSFAKEYNDLFYIDTDCFLCALPTEEEIEQNKIIMGETITADGPIMNTFLFYVNNQKEFFLENYEKLIEKRNRFSLSQKQYQLFLNKTIPFEPFSYYHFSLLNLEIEINRQYNVLSNRLIEYEKEINSYRNAIQGMVQTVELYNKLREKQGK